MRNLLSHSTSIFILMFISFYASGQTYNRIVFRQDTFYTISSKIFHDSNFIKPNNLPNGKWLVFEKDTLLGYKFNIFNDAVNGEFEEFHNGIFFSKGKYHMDSLWTFRFSKFYDNRFKEGKWIKATHYFDSTGPRGVEYIFEQWQNLWYDNGIKKYETRNNIQTWYYPNGSIKCQQTFYEREKEKITIQETFDTYGQLIKLVTTNCNSYFLADTAIKFLPVIPNSHNIQKEYFAHAIEFVDTYKSKEIIEDNKSVTIITFDRFGTELTHAKLKR